MRRLAVLLVAILVGSTVAAVPAAADGTTIDHDGETLSLSAGPAQQITGQTDLAAGTEVTIRLELDGSSSPMLHQLRTTVDDDGQFAVTVDLHRADPGASGSVSVRTDGRELARTHLTVTGCDGTCEPVQTVAPTAESPFSFEGTMISLSAGPAQQITGQTDLAAGTEVTVRLRSSDNSAPFIRQTAATVGDDGRFSVQMNLSAVAPDTEAVATLRSDGKTIAEHGVVIDAPNSVADDSTAQHTGPVLGSSIVRVQNGEAVAITVDYGATDAATLSIHSDGVDDVPTWEVVATVRDSDGDGTATIRFDTGAVDADAPTVTADDDLTIDRESSLSDAALDPAAYDIRLDSGSVIDDDPTDIGTLVLTAGGATDDVTDETTPANATSEQSSTTDTNGENGTGATTTTVAATDSPATTESATDSPATEGSTNDLGIVGGSAVGILTLFGVGARLLN